MHFIVIYMISNQLSHIIVTHTHRPIGLEKFVIFCKFFTITCQVQKEERIKKSMPPPKKKGFFGHNTMQIQGTVSPNTSRLPTARFEGYRPVLVPLTEDISCHRMELYLVGESK